MSLPVFYKGEIRITPPLTAEHEVLVLDISSNESNDATRPVYAAIAARQQHELPAHIGMIDIVEHGMLLVPEDDESTHGLDRWLQLLAEHVFSPLGYSATGVVSWTTDDAHDRGLIFMKDNNVERVSDVISNPGPSWEPSDSQLNRLKRAAHNVIDSADDAGCSPDLTVIFTEALERLREAVLENAEGAASEDNQGQPPVAAEIHSDDHRATANFLANRWLSQAAEEDIRALARIDWRGDYPADAVALFMESIDLPVRRVLDYCRSETGISDPPVGFEVVVDRAEALSWLAVHRPGLSEELTVDA